MNFEGVGIQMFGVEMDTKTPLFVNQSSVYFFDGTGMVGTAQRN